MSLCLYLFTEYSVNKIRTFARSRVRSHVRTFVNIHVRAFARSYAFCIFAKKQKESIMILSTVSLKGGGGKTTTAVNFAVYFAMKGKSVVIVDTDVNTHIEKWNERRPDDLPNVDFAVLNTPQLIKQNFDDIAARYDVVIVDGRPAVDEIAAIILSISDVAVIPVKPSPLDLWANDGNFIDVYLKTKKHNTDLKAFFLLNEVKPNTDISADVRAELHEYKESTDIITLEHQMSSRVTYAKAFLYGHGVLETSNFRARGEFRLVADEVVKLANIKF